jgi:hypothetical protein
MLWTGLTSPQLEHIHPFYIFVCAVMQEDCRRPPEVQDSCQTACVRVCFYVNEREREREREDRQHGETETFAEG